MAATNGHLRNMTFNETFESSLVEKVNDKFTVDKSLIKGIKYALAYLGKMTSARLSTRAKFLGEPLAMKSSMS